MQQRSRLLWKSTEAWYNNGQGHGENQKELDTTMVKVKELDTILVKFMWKSAEAGHKNGQGLGEYLQNWVQQLPTPG